MKKTIKAIMLSLLATLTVAACVVFAACGGKGDVVFSQKAPAMGGLIWTYSATLKSDNTFEFTVTDEQGNPLEGNLSQVGTMLGKSGTYKFENDKYTLTFSTPVKNANDEDVTTVSSTFADGKYTLAFGVKGPDRTIQLQLTHTK